MDALGWRAGRGNVKKGKGRSHVEATVAAAQFNEEDLTGRPFDGGAGARVEEWIEENLSGYLAESAAKQYAGVYGKWRAWARRQGWVTEFLDKANLPRRTTIKDGRKRAGKGDPTERMYRLWMMLHALEKRARKKARRLGVAPEMLKWLANFVTQAPIGQVHHFDAVMLNAVLQTAWFFVLRAKEFCDSNGVDFEMILRGVDLKFLCSSDQVDGVTLQFRKTKVDQEAFGECKTLYVSGIPEVCVVTALLKFKAVAPQRFGSGCEALKPLFRWSSGRMLTRGQVQNVLQKAATACGLPAGRFMSHSLRIGGASALFQSTGEIELVKRNGRWSSSAVQRYLHDGEVALRHTAEKMAKVEQKIHYT